MNKMSESKRITFDEAEQRRGSILAWTASACGVLGWLLSGSAAGVGLVAALAAYLLTGDRYQWIYIWRKTVYRDLLGFCVLLPMIIRVWFWEKNKETVVSIWSGNVMKYGDKKAIIMGDRNFSFRQGDEFTNRVACYFKQQGFKPGEVVALLMGTQPDYVFIWLGLAKIGVVTALINNNLKGAQLMHCIKVANCKSIIFGVEMTHAMKEIDNELGDTKVFQYNSPEHEHEPIFGISSPLAAELKKMPITPLDNPHKAKPRDILLYIYTSGTTGLPKAAIINNMRYLFISTGLHAASSLSSSDIVYDPLPLHHTAGGVLGVGQALVHGCTVVLRQKFSATNYWKDAAKYGCTVTQYIGEMCRYLLAVPPSLDDQNHKVRVVLGNGLRPQIWEQFVQRFGVEKVVEFYGATEGNSNLVNLDSKVGAIGFLSRFVSFLYPLILVKCDEITGDIIRDGKGRCIPCQPFKPGLLLGKIDKKKVILSFAGYADKKASEKKMVLNVKNEGDCFFNSGDVFVMDHFGYFYFKDRTGDTFRWRGENVSTAEVEGVISTLIGLNDAIIFGVPVPNVEGKAGMAAISDPDKKLDLVKLAKGLKENLPVYARPLFLRILPETPLTSTFKLKKKELIEQGFGESKDELFFLDQKTGEYVSLTQKLRDDIINGVIRL